MTRSRSLSAWCVDHPVATVLLTFALVLSEEDANIAQSVRAGWTR